MATLKKIILLSLIVLATLGTALMAGRAIEQGHGGASSGQEARQARRVHAWLQGTIRDQDTDLPIKGAFVQTRGVRCFTDEEGRFELGSLSAGELSLRVTKVGYKSLETVTRATGGQNRIELYLTSAFDTGGVGNLSYSPVAPEVIWSGNPNRKRIAITIDDGWSPDYRIIDLLQKQNVRATAFIVGDRGVADEHPELVARLEEAGFEVANHGYRHRTVTDLNDEHLTEEIRKGQEVITGVTNRKYPYFRPSGGNYDRRTLGVIAANGYKLVLWSIDSKDTRRGLTTQQRVDNVLANLHNGAIIVTHFAGYGTYDLLSILIPELKSRGYEIGTVSDVLEE